MKKLIAITILSIMLIITQENACESFKNEQECDNANKEGKSCIFQSTGENIGTCYEIVSNHPCQWDSEKHRCLIESGEEEPDSQVCGQGSLNEEEGKISCELVDAQCYDYISSKEKCLSLKNYVCGYDEKREYEKCFFVTLDEGCEFKDNKCTIDSTKEFCELTKDEYNRMSCKKRNIKCSDLDQDSSNCPKIDLQENNKKCSYDSSRSSGNKCFEVLIGNGCTYDNACTGMDLPNWKICDMDMSGNPITCQLRNIQCSDFNQNENNCKSAKLPDKTKECSYSENQCIEKEVEAKCNYDNDKKECTSTLSSKIKCGLNSDENGCVEKNVECSDFEADEAGCNGAIISNSNKKCQYDNTKAENKCTEIMKDCSDFYNEQECNRYKPQDALAKCVWSKECKIKTCETTSIENCGSFIPNDSKKQCALNDAKTKCEEKLKPESQPNNGAKCLKLLLTIISLLFIF